MLIYLNTNGTIEAIQPTSFTQGSNDGELIVIGEGLSAYSTIDVKFKTPVNNQLINGGFMVPLDNFVVNDSIINAYKLIITENITNFAGNLQITFKVTDANERTTNSYIVTIPIIATLEPSLPTVPDTDWYEAITQAFAYITGKIDAVPTDIENAVNAHNTSNSAHADIRTLITNIVNGTTIVAKAYGDENGANINVDYQKKIDNSLNTTNKTIVGAINEVKAIADVLDRDATTTVRGAVTYATDSEASAGILENKVINPKQLQSNINSAIIGAVIYKGVWTITGATGYSFFNQFLPIKQGWEWYCQGTKTIIDGVEYTQGDYARFNQDVAVGTTITTSMIDKIDNTDTVVSVDGQTGVVNTNSVKYTTQSLTDTQKTQARTNIGAGSQTDVNRISTQYVGGNTNYAGTLVTNLDTITKNGFYTITGTGTGLPNSNYSWFVIHQNSNSGTNFATQRAVAFNSEIIVYERTKTNAVWNDWVSANVSSEALVPQIRFNGTLSGNIISGTLDSTVSTYTFVNQALVNIYLVLPLTTLTGVLNSNYVIRLYDKDNNLIVINNINHTSAITSANVGDMCQLQNYNVNTGYEWQFTARYSQFDNGGTTARVLYTTDIVRESVISLTGGELYTHIVNNTLRPNTYVLVNDSYTNSGTTYTEGVKYKISGTWIDGELFTEALQESDPTREDISHKVNVIDAEQPSATNYVGEVGLVNYTNDNFVSVNVQTLTTEQKAQARANIGAGSSSILLYTTTGQNSDGAMTQKATTDALNTKANSSTTINGKALTANITLNATDVGADASGTASSLVSAHNVSATAHTDIRTLANEAKTIAQGKARSQVFDTFIAMTTWLSDIANKDILAVGDNLYIKQTDVADYWVTQVLSTPNSSGYYYDISPLESEVPDISNMVTTDTAQTITGNKNFTGNLQKNGVDVLTGVKTINGQSLVGTGNVQTLIWRTW